VRPAGLFLAVIDPAHFDVRPDCRPPAADLTAWVDDVVKNAVDHRIPAAAGGYADLKIYWQ
jgi:hypothetical protein